MNNKRAYIHIIVVIAIGILVLRAFACITDKSCEVKRAAPNNEEIQQTITEQVNNYYALIAVVVEIDKAQDIVTVEDYNGNLWQFTGVEDWEKDDCVGLIMNDNLTDDIYDDEIVSVKYQGWNVEY